MATPVNVSRFEAKSHDSPDETRSPDKTRIEVIRLEGYTIGRFNFEPGWRWSEHMKPIAGTDSCEATHLIYAISGKMHVAMNDGSEGDIGPGDFASISPGHDAWVVGDEPFVGVDFGGYSQYAKGS